MLKVLSFTGIVGEDGNLSLTNIAVIVCVTKMALAVQFSGVDAVALIGALLNYAHRRQVGSDGK